MSIAEQVLQLKSDFDNVYIAGYNKGLDEGGNSTDNLVAGICVGLEAEKNSSAIKLNLSKYDLSTDNLKKIFKSLKEFKFEYVKGEEFSDRNNIVDVIVVKSWPTDIWYEGEGGARVDIYLQYCTVYMKPDVSYEEYGDMYYLLTYSSFEDYPEWPTPLWTDGKFWWPIKEFSQTGTIILGNNLVKLENEDSIKSIATNKGWNLIETE